jgi:plasmid stabilization system protein ParE
LTAQRCEVEFAESAVDDLRGILAWYLSQQVPEVGASMVVAIIEHVERLAVFPDSGRVVPEFETPWLREVQLPPYRIVYRHEGARVTVVRVWRSERLMDPTLAEDS